MKKTFAIFISVLLYCGSFSVYAQTPSFTSATSGKKFYITFLQNITGNFTGSNNLQLKVVVEEDSYITAKYNEQTNLYLNDGNADWNNLLVESGIYTLNVLFDDVINYPAADTGITSSKTITLTSSKNINVYAINHEEISTDATCILPVSIWGNEYRLAVGDPSSIFNNYIETSSLYAVVAKENDTNVTLHNDTTITLHENQVYHFRSLPFVNLTGQKISSNKPVGVFSGSDASWAPGQSGDDDIYGFGCNNLSQFGGTGDHTYEQLWSVDKWGKEFFAFPIETPGGSGNWGGMLAIIAHESGTNVALSGGINTNYTNLSAGSTQYVCAVMSELTKITSNKPIMVFLVLPDATVTTIQPIDRRIDHALIAPFRILDNTSINSHAIDLLIPAVDWDNTEIKEDGLVVLNTTYTIMPNSQFPDWLHVRKDFFDPFVDIEITCSSGGFLAYMSGSGYAESYAFLVGGASFVRGVGTVFPFVYNDDPLFDNLFAYTVELYDVPFGEPDPIDWIQNNSPVHTATTVYYDNSMFVPGTPKFPGTIGRTNQPGIPINWAQIGRVQDPSTSYITVSGPGDVPLGDPVGVFTFENLPVGKDFILYISRPGYLARYAKITIADGYFGHRFLIPGDVNDDGYINTDDTLELNANFSSYGRPAYQPKYDLDANARADSHDNSLLNGYLGSFNEEIYSDTKDWLDNYW